MTGTATPATIAVVGPAAYAVIDATAAASAIEALSRCVAAPNPLDELQGLVQVGGFTSLPGFALAMPEAAGLRVIVRGRFTAEVSDDEGTAARVGGAGVGTWTEQLLPGDGRLRFLVGGEAGEPESTVLVAPASGSPCLDVPPAAAPRRPARPQVAAPPPVEEVPTPVDPDHTMLPPATERRRDDDTTATVLIDSVPRFSGEPGAAAGPETGRVPEPAPASPVLGDHDGQTVRRAVTGAGWPATSAGGPGPPTVQATVCAAGHPNPPPADRCRLCGAAIPNDRNVTSVVRPSLGVIRTDQGQVVDLARSVIFGRSPTEPAGRPGEVFTLVAVPSPDQSVSRSHVEIRLDGWLVWAVDLDARNGTTVSLPGAAPVRLRPDEPFLLVDGARIDLGTEASLSYQVAPS